MERASRRDAGARLQWYGTTTLRKGIENIKERRRDLSMGSENGSVAMIISMERKLGSRNEAREKNAKTSSRNDNK